MTLPNTEIATALDDIASLLEIEEASPFRIRAYRNAADTVRSLSTELSALVAAGDDLTQLPDIGSAIAAKIKEMIEDGRVTYLDKLAPDTAPGLLDLLRIPGLGPRRIRVLRDELGIGDVDGLRAAAEAQRLRDLPGFGAKTEERLLRRARRHAGETDAD